MAYTEDHIALAAEYALGTLDADERVQVETMMAVDKEFAAVVQAWEFRLGALNQMVASVEPQPVVWENITAAIGQARTAQEPLVLPETAPPPLPVQPEAAPQLSTARDVSVLRLMRRVNRWRKIASGAGVLAAVLFATLALQVYRRDVPPNVVHPAPGIETKEAKTEVPAPAPPSPASSSNDVALLQGSVGGPAFILTIDTATRGITVRTIHATPPEPGRSFELWLMSDKLPAPRSLGVIGASDFTAHEGLADIDADTINAATYAVTIEQAGGSPTGQPTSAPAFSGKLIEPVPKAAQPQADK